MRSYVQAWEWRKERKGGTAWEKGYGIVMVFDIVDVGIRVVVTIVVFHSADVNISADVVIALSIVTVLLLLLRSISLVAVIVVPVDVAMLT